MIKVLIVDDDQLIGESLKILLGTDADLEIVGTCLNGADALTYCQKYYVNVILMDIRMPICDGVQATRHIKQQFPHIKIIILTTFNDDHYIIQALRNGASGYLLKTVEPAKIIESIKIVAKGNMLLHPDIADKIQYLMTASTSEQLLKRGLTSAQIEIMALIAEGLSNKEIAKQLHFSEGTIKNKITQILSLLKLRDRTQIAIFYLKGGQMT